MAAPTHAEVRAESCGYCLAGPGESCVVLPGHADKIRVHHTARRYAALSRVRRTEAEENARAKERANEALREKIGHIVSEYAIFADDGDKAAVRIMKLIEEAGK